MISMTMKLSNDSKSLTVGWASEVTLNAAELESLMRDLAMMRARMLPEMPNQDLTVNTTFSVVPCTRWSTSLDPDAPTQIRLYLMHLGIGWVWIALNEQSCVELSEALGTMLRARPSLS